MHDEYSVRFVTSKTESSDAKHTLSDKKREKVSTPLVDWKEESEWFQFQGENQPLDVVLSLQSHCNLPAIGVNGSAKSRPKPPTNDKTNTALPKVVCLITSSPSSNPDVRLKTWISWWLFGIEEDGQQLLVRRPAAAGGDDERTRSVNHGQQLLVGRPASAVHAISYGSSGFVMGTVGSHGGRKSQKQVEDWTNSRHLLEKSSTAQYTHDTKIEALGFKDEGQ
ncbi:hypothetical protein ACLOJK_011923 [Asimina triloba]